MNKKKRKILLTAACIILVLTAVGIWFFTGAGKESDDTDDMGHIVSGDTDNPAQTETSPMAQNDGPFYYEEGVLSSLGESNWFFPMLSFDSNNHPIYIKSSVEEITEEYYNTEYYMYKITETKTEQIGPMLGYVEVNQEKTESKTVLGYTFDAEGNLYVMNSNGDTDMTLSIYSSDYNIVKKDGLWEGKRALLRSAKYYDGKIYTINNYNELEIHTLDGELLKNPLTYSRFESLDIDSFGNLYLIVYNEGDSDYIVKFDINKNEKIYQTAIKSAYYIDYNEAEDSIYIAGNDGIKKYDSQGKLIKNALTFGRDTSFFTGSSLSGDLWFSAFASDIYGNLYIIGYAGDESFIYKFTKTPGTKEKLAEAPKKEIVITAGYKQDFLADAAERYNRQSQDTKIVFDVLYQTRTDAVANMDSAIQTLTTKIMTNDVGDIVATGGMGLYYYDVLQTDAFIDLGEYIKNDKNYNNLNYKVLDGLTIDGKITGLPIEIQFTTMIYNKELGDELGLDFDYNNVTWSEIISLAEMVEESNNGTFLFAATDSSLDNLLYPMIVANMPDLIDINNKTYDLRQDWFIELIEEFKAASKLSSFFNPISSSFTDLTGNGLFRYLRLDGDISSYDWRYENGKYDIRYLPAFSGEINRNAVAYPAVMYSISNNSQNKAEAWDFLSFLLEETTQGLGSLKIAPLNLKTIENIYEWNDVSVEVSEQLDTIFNTVDYLYTYDAYRHDIIFPLLDYINDEITLDEALEKAEYNVWLRLNE